MAPVQCPHCLREVAHGVESCDAVGHVVCTGHPDPLVFQQVYHSVTKFSVQCAKEPAYTSSRSRFSTEIAGRMTMSSLWRGRHGSII